MICLFFVDPNPFLIEMISSDDRLRSKNIRLVFSDLRYVKVYKREKLLKAFAIYHLVDFCTETDCAIRGSERYQGFVIKGGKDYKQRKRECYFSEEKLAYETEEEFVEHIWHLPFTNTNFQRTFIRSVRNMEAYEVLQKKSTQKAVKEDTLGVQPLKPLSMMGFYLFFFCNPDAPFTGKSLDRERCEKMLTGIGSEANGIRNLVFGQSQASDILDAIKNYVAIHNPLQNRCEKGIISPTVRIKSVV